MSPPDVESSAPNSITRRPPYSLEAEKAVLGSMFISREAIPRAVEVIQSPDYFYRRSHRLIFDVIRDMFQDDREVDGLTVAEELESRDQLSEVQGSHYIAELVDTVPSSANVEHYAEIVKKYYLLRELINTCNDVIEECYDSEEDARELIDKAEEKIFSLRDDQVTGRLEPLSEIIKDTFERLDEASERDGVISGLKTGYTKLDNMTSGLHEGQLIIIASRPGMGKTSFALNVAQNVALGEDKPVAIFSLEMLKQDLSMRFLSAESRVPFGKLRSGRFSDSDWQRIANGFVRLGDAPIYIEDTPNQNVLDLKAKARRLKAEHDVSLILLDYLQLMSPVSDVDSRVQALTQISRGLKQLAIELQVPVISLTQLNREVERRGGDKRPQLSDLRGSGAIEQDADVVGFLYRPYYYTENEEDKGNAELILGKQRNGATGKIPLIFNAEYMRFDSRKDEPEPVGF